MSSAICDEIVDFVASDADASDFVKKTRTGLGLLADLVALAVALADLNVSSARAKSQQNHPSRPWRDDDSETILKNFSRLPVEMNVDLRVLAVANMEQTMEQQTGEILHISVAFRFGAGGIAAVIAPAAAENAEQCKKYSEALLLCTTTIPGRVDGLVDRLLDTGFAPVAVKANSAAGDNTMSHEMSETLLQRLTAHLAAAPGGAEHAGAMKRLNTQFQR